jgi:hypothetical protein
MSAMDVLAILLGLVMFAVLVAFIYGIEKI